jgi:hypothetical protein
MTCLTREEAEQRLRDLYEMAESTARSVIDLANEFGNISLWVRADQELVVYAFEEEDCYDMFQTER